MEKKKKRAVTNSQFFVDAFGNTAPHLLNSPKSDPECENDFHLLIAKVF